MYELPHELPNDLRLQKSLKTLKNFTQSPGQNENFVNTSKKLFKNKNQTFPVMHSSIWKLG